MDAKSVTTDRLFVPSGKTLSILAIAILTSCAIALEYQAKILGQSFGIFLFPLLVSTIVCALVGIWVVPLLTRLKTGQIVREDGPQSHLKKAGTPTMGGIFFVPTAAIIASISSVLNPNISGITPEAIAVILATLGYGAIGWLDDWQVLRKKSNKGISPRMKLVFQIFLGVLFALWLFWQESTSITSVTLPGGINLTLGWFFLPLAVFIFSAESNATNLTDGVDGLAAGTGAIALLGMGAIIAPDYPDLAIFCACLSGGCLGFLIHNRNPASVFMGDTGSLALGGALAAVGLSSGHLWSLFIVSGIFFIESVSVIAQVSYYKATKDEMGKGKRLFKMAPIHHHFELSGWKETQVVGVFYLASFILAAIAYLIN